MRQAMRDQLRAYLIKTAGLTPNAGNAEAKGGKPNEAGKPLFGFLMDAGTKGVQVTADDHHELRADAFVVDRVLGSVGIVHCVDFPDGNEATWEAQVRGWVEDAAHLRHLMAMRMESVRARTGDRGKFLPTVELVFVVNVGDAGAGAGEGASRPMSVLRGQLKAIKAKTELPVIPEGGAAEAVAGGWLIFLATGRWHWVPTARVASRCEDTAPVLGANRVFRGVKEQRIRLRGGCEKESSSAPEWRQLVGMLQGPVEAAGDVLKGGLRIPQELAVEAGEHLKEVEGQDEDQKPGHDGHGMVMGAVIQVVMLGQFVEGMVLDPPALVAHAPDGLRGIGVEFGGRDPAPVGASRGGHSPAGDSLGLDPGLVGQNHPHGFGAVSAKLQVPNLPQGDLAILPFQRDRLLALGQHRGLLVHGEALLLEHADQPPSQPANGADKGGLGVPSVGGHHVEEPRAVETAQATQQAQGRRTLLLAGANGFQVQHHAELWTVELRPDQAVIGLDHLGRLAVGATDGDPALAAVLATTAPTLEVLVGVQGDDQKPVDLRRLEGPVALEGLVGGHQHRAPVLHPVALADVAQEIILQCRLQAHEPTPTGPSGVLGELQEGGHPQSRPQEEAGTDRRGGDDRVGSGVADGAEAAGQVEDLGAIAPELGEEVHSGGVLQWFIPADQLGIDLGEFLQLVPEGLVGLDPVPGDGLLGRGFEQELPDVAGLESGGQVVERAVALAAGATAVGLSTGGKPLDEGRPQQVRRDLEGTPQPVPSLTQSQGRFPGQLEYLRQLLGQDAPEGSPGQEKDSALPTGISSNPCHPVTCPSTPPPPSGITAELLHAISVNLVQWKPAWIEGEADAAWARGFSWLLLQTRAWIASQEAALGTDSAAAPPLKWNRIVASNLRVSGERAWQIAHWGPAGAEMHVVHGPNGSGKSSLAEVFEFALTGKSRRLRTPADLKPLLWRDAEGQSANASSAWVTMASVSDAQKRPYPGSNEPATSPNEDGFGHALRHVAGEAEPVAQLEGKRPRVDGIRG